MPLDLKPPDAAPALRDGRTILFDADDPGCGLESRPCRVEPGQALLVTAFRMPEGGEAWAEMIVTTTTAPAPWENCGPLPPFPQSIDARSVRPSLGGPDEWRLDEERPQMLIALPGTYRFVLKSAGMIQDTGLVVESVALDLMRLPWVRKAVTR